MIDNYVGFVPGKVWQPTCRLQKGPMLHSLASQYIGFFDRNLVGEEDEVDERPIEDRVNELEDNLISGDIQPLLDLSHFILYDCHGVRDDGGILVTPEILALREATGLQKLITDLFAPENVENLVPISSINPGDVFIASDGRKYRSIITHVPVSGRSIFQDGTALSIKEIDVEARSLDNGEAVIFHVPVGAPEAIFMVHRCADLEDTTADKKENFDKHWKLKRQNLVRKYGKMYEAWNSLDVFDDRRMFCNIYEMLLEICDTMRSVKSNYVSLAVTKEVNADTKTMDEIIDRFRAR